MGSVHLTFALDSLLLQIFLLILDYCLDLLQAFLFLYATAFSLLMRIQQGRAIACLTSVIVSILSFDLMILSLKLSFILFVNLHHRILIFSLRLYLSYLLFTLFLMIFVFRLFCFELITTPNTIYLQRFFLFMLLKLLFCYLLYRIGGMFSTLFALHQTASLWHFLLLLFVYLPQSFTILLYFLQYLWYYSSFLVFQCCIFIEKHFEVVFHKQFLIPYYFFVSCCRSLFTAFMALIFRLLFYMPRIGPFIWELDAFR